MSRVFHLYAFLTHARESKSSLASWTEISKQLSRSLKFRRAVSTDQSNFCYITNSAVNIRMGIASAALPARNETNCPRAQSELFLLFEQSLAIWAPPKL